MERIKKTSQVLSAIACELIDKDPDDRMEPFLSLAQRLGVSNGTVQNAVHQMQRDGALLLTSRGYLGSFIAALDRQKLLEYIGISSVYWAMPIPYSKRYEGFASGLRVALDALGLTMAEMIAYREHPLDKLPALVEHRVPAMLVWGDADRTVPFAENGLLLQRAYERAGVPLLVQRKPGCAHHPHGPADLNAAMEFLSSFH